MFTRVLSSTLQKALGKPFVHILFGARQTGKSFLIRHLIPDPSCFAKMEIKHGTLVFATGLDYGQDILRIWCENGGVADQEGTDKLAALYLPYKELSLQIA